MTLTRRQFIKGVIGVVVVYNLPLLPNLSVSVYGHSPIQRALSEASVFNEDTLINILNNMPDRTPNYITITNPELVKKLIKAGVKLEFYPDGTAIIK